MEPESATKFARIALIIASDDSGRVADFAQSNLEHGRRRSHEHYEGVRSELSFKAFSEGTVALVGEDGADCPDFLMFFYSRPDWHAPTRIELIDARSCVLKIVAAIGSIGADDTGRIAAANLVVSPLGEMAEVLFSRRTLEVMEENKELDSQGAVSASVRGDFQAQVRSSPVLSTLVGDLNAPITEGEVAEFDSEYLTLMFRHKFKHHQMVHFPSWVDFTHYTLVLADSPARILTLWRMALSTQIPFSFYDVYATFHRPHPAQSPALYYEHRASLPGMYGWSDPLKFQWMAFAGRAIGSMRHLSREVVDGCLGPRLVARATVHDDDEEPRFDMIQLYYSLTPTAELLNPVYQCLVARVEDGSFDVASVPEDYKTLIYASIMHMARMTTSAIAPLVRADA